MYTRFIDDIKDPFEIPNARAAFALTEPAGFDACAQMVGEARLAVEDFRAGRGEAATARAASVRESAERIANVAIGSFEDADALLAEWIADSPWCAADLALVVIDAADVLDSLRYGTSAKAVPKHLAAARNARAVRHALCMVDIARWESEERARRSGAVHG